MLVRDNSQRWLALAGRRVPGLGAVPTVQPYTRPTSNAIVSSPAQLAQGTIPTQLAASATQPSPQSAADAYAQDATAAINKYCSGGAAKCGCTVDSASIDSLFQTSATSRFLMWPPPDSKFADCSGISRTNTTEKIGAALPAAGGAVAAGAITAGAAAGSIVPVLGTAIGAISGLIVSLFGAGHAKAVQAQNQALCTAVPEFNQVVHHIDAALAAGSITPSQAQSQYSSLMSSFTSAMQSGTSYKKCDGLYAYNMAAQMVIAARNADLQAGLLTGGSPLPSGSSSSDPLSAISSGISSAISSITGGAGIPTPVLVLGGLLLAYALLD